MLTVSPDLARAIVSWYQRRKFTDCGPRMQAAAAAARQSETLGTTLSSPWDFCSLCSEPSQFEVPTARCHGIRIMRALYLLHFFKLLLGACLATLLADGAGI